MLDTFIFYAIAGTFLIVFWFLAGFGLMKFYEQLDGSFQQLTLFRWKSEEPPKYCTGCHIIAVPTTGKIQRTVIPRRRSPNRLRRILRLAHLSPAPEQLAAQGTTTPLRSTGIHLKGDV